MWRTRTWARNLTHLRSVVVAVLWLGLVGCGDGGKQPDAAVSTPLVDAPGDAFGTCGSKQDCGALHCCADCGPGGACGPSVCDDPAKPSCGRVLCDPAEGACITRSGAAGTCTQVFPGAGWACN